MEIVGHLQQFFYRNAGIEIFFVSISCFVSLGTPFKWTESRKFFKVGIFFRPRRVLGVQENAILTAAVRRGLVQLW